MTKEKSNIGFKDWFNNLDWLRKIGVITIVAIILGGNGSSLINVVKQGFGINVTAAEYLTKDEHQRDKKLDSLFWEMKLRDIKDSIHSSETRIIQKIDRFYYRNKKYNSKNSEEDYFGNK